MSESTVDITCPVSRIHDESFLTNLLLKKGIPKDAEVFLIRKWIDARKRPVKYGLRYTWDEHKVEKFLNIPNRDIYKNDHRETIHIIGAGPAGYFAALECLQLGLKPVVFDRGKDVQARRRDLRAIQQDHIVNPDSNYCFGEGGAGTYSDGKLYTRSKNKHEVRKVLKLLVQHGAVTDILIDAHAHIGSNKLPKIIASIRETIELFGGEVRFNSKVTDLEIGEGQVKSITINDSEEIQVKHVILATGHSARGIYKMFHDKDLSIEAKPFALGMRIEHPQKVIDKIQYGTRSRPHNLPAASYSIACEIDRRGVYSFCMCPGGLVVPAATSPGEIVVNGMSLSRRDSPYANSGLVVGIHPEDVSKNWQENPFTCMEFQKEMEQKAFAYADGSQKAPTQRLLDFISGKQSHDLPPTSYIPGNYSADLNDMLPNHVRKRLHSGLEIFKKRMNGYIHPEAVLIGFESRTSAPVKIPRNHETFSHPQVSNLYPCGEGAGYAGGIMSAAIDGMRIVSKIAQNI